METAPVRLEEGMVLNCLCPWDGSLSMVSWNKVPDKDPIAILHPEYGVTFAHQYRERIDFLRTTPMDGSISMTNVTHQDIGVYHCSVQTFPQGPWTRNIQVEDLGKRWQKMFRWKSLIRMPRWMMLEIKRYRFFHLIEAFRFLSFIDELLPVCHPPSCVHR